ncbi:hypothetical protein F5883DRAFT_544335 [Diaporthe sp. PMI_573]|nr:hypothetical protein F5883DRAFT_544335 [Diaporthaceae sp. PMI_573]
MTKPQAPHAYHRLTVLRVVCFVLGALTFHVLGVSAGFRSHGPSGRRPKPVLDRPKSEFAGSLSAANALCGRHHAATL